MYHLSCTVLHHYQLHRHVCQAKAMLTVLFMLRQASLLQLCILSMVQSLGRFQRRSRRKLKRAAIRATTRLQQHVRVVNAALGMLTGAAARWLMSTSAAVCRRCRWGMADILQPLSWLTAWHAKRVAVRAAAVRCSQSQDSAGHAPKPLAARQQIRSSKRRQRRSSPASATAPAAKPSRRARRKLANAVAAAQDTPAAAESTGAMVTVAAPDVDEALVQQDEAVLPAAGMECKTVVDIQQQAAAGLHVATVDDVTKLSSDVQNTIKVSNARATSAANCSTL
jgi:hypothetical protein